ncbi:MAG: hypothetical protein M0R66_07630 [Candidatus Omnitrophica bacterium]|nr:hypothetical protein [Candidatus Omnitrophota bacterium]
MPPIVEELSTIFVAPISHYRRIFHERDVCYDRDAWTEKGGSNWAAYSETVTKKIGFRKLGDAPVGLIGAVPFRAKLAREVKDPPTDVDDYLFSQDYAPPIDFSSRFEDLFSALNASESNDDVYSEFTDPENVDEFLAYFSREIDRLFQNDTWLEKYEDLVDSLEKAGFDVDYDDVGSVLIACEYDSRVTAYWEVKVNDYVDISKFTDVYLENVRDDDVKRLKESGFRGKVHKLGDGGLYGGR